MYNSYEKKGIQRHGHLRLQLDGVACKRNTMKGKAPDHILVIAQGITCERKPAAESGSPGPPLASPSIFACSTTSCSQQIRAVHVGIALTSGQT